MARRKDILGVTAALIVGPGVRIDGIAREVVGINPPVIFDHNVSLAVADHPLNQNLDVRDPDPVQALIPEALVAFCLVPALE